MLASPNFNVSVLDSNETLQNTTYVSPPILSSLKQTELLVWIIVTASISFIGAFNNILLLLVTWPSKTSGRIGINLLIFHFVAANLFMCLINIPISIFMVQAKRAGYVAAASACNVIHAIYTMNSTAINWTDVGLAVNRCIALFFPHSYKAWTSIPVNLGIVTFAWIVGAVAALPFSFGLGGSMVLFPLGQCVYKPKDILGMFLTSLVTYIPYSVAGGAAFLILWKSYRLSRARIGGQNVDIKNRPVILRRMKMAKMLLLTFLWGAICNLPWGVITVNFPGLFLQDLMTTLWVRTCVPCQYGFVPCILLLSNREYRARLKQIWRLIIPKQPTIELKVIGSLQ